jgi:ABC-2 type transport system ATP-binding protein
VRTESSAPVSNDVVVRATQVSKRFGSRLALAPLDFELRRGETVALLGPNGAGKSTLLALLAGSMAPSGGQVVWADGARVGWAPQRPAQYGRLSARENLELFARLEGEADPVEAAERLLAAFRLPADGQPSSELSVGNRQRLNVAIALLGNPDALLLDEPTASLDPGQRKRLWETVSEFRNAGGAVVIASQSADELAGADRVLVLHGGERTFDGSVAAYLRTESADVLA